MDKTHVYLFLELCDQGLDQYIKDKGGKISESEARTFGLQILNGLSALHSVNMSHRDLKLDNVLLKNGQCKISDLGFGSDQKILNTTVGAIGIRAPEYKIGRAHV